ncbi:MAG TPA: type II secretion system F family protein [Vicinamibacterales bacterium]|nr:type II secretion system F family protein [Vicinamibacterales bacterium]
MELNITVTLISVFVAVGLFAWSLGNLAVERSSPTRRRLDSLVAAGDQLFIPESAVAARKHATLVPLSPKKMSSLQRRLTTAGFHQPNAASYFTAIQLSLTLVLGLTPILVMGQTRGLLLAAFGAVLGYLAPGMVLDRRVSQRRLRIENGLPDALDLLIVSLEAGLALDQAILKCAEELAIAHPDVAEELRLVNVECRAGKPRIEAFKNFAARTKVDDVRALVAMLVQTDRFGTSVAQALRTHAEVSRTKRRQKAEERAAKIGVKLVFPLVFCLFPAFYVVTLGPAIIKFIKAFGSGGFATGGVPLP